MSRVSEQLADASIAVLTDGTTTADATNFVEGTTFTAAEKAMLANAIVVLVKACKDAGILKGV